MVITVTTKIININAARIIPRTICGTTVGSIPRAKELVVIAVV